MLRFRRYRALLIFTVVFVIVFVHFSRSRDWQTVLPPDHLPDHDRPPPVGLFDQRPRPAPPSSDKELSADSGPPSKTTGNGQQGKNKNAGGGSYRKGKQGISLFPPINKLPHWKKLPEQFPLAPTDLIKLPTGEPKALPRLQAQFKDEPWEDKPKRLRKLAAIRDSFEHAWTGYKASAMGHDELSPMRGGFRDSFNGWGATLVGTLDTLWIMDLKEEFLIAVDQVKNIDFTISDRKDIPVFEVVIRYLGGLLGAYDISGHKYPVLLDKAKELAEVLIGAFDTPNRMPNLLYRWAPEFASKPQRAGHQTILAEIGSLSMEFTRLAQLTNDDRYYDAIARITNELERIQGSTRLPGLWPSKLDATGCEKSTPLHVAHYLGRGDASNTSSPVLGHGEKPVPTDIETYRHFLDQRDQGGLAQDAQPAKDSQIANEKLENHGGDGDDGLPEEDCRGTLKSQGMNKDRFGLGAEADSTYESLSKEYMLLGGQNEQYRNMYEKAMDAARQHLLFQPMVKHGRDLRFLATLNMKKPLTELQPGQLSSKYEGSHLSCYAGGMFAVGAKLFGINGDLDIAAKLTDGCVWAYESTYTGIMPESFLLLPCKKGEPCKWDETRYKAALDPDREERLAVAKMIQEKVPKQAKDKDVEGNNVDETEPSVSPAPSVIVQNRKGILDKRDDWQITATPAPTGRGASIAHRDLISPSYEEPVAFPDDYVKSRIRNERLPPGIVRMTSRSHLLRPEAIESVFLMYRLTGDEYWREKGWKMFEAVSKHTRTQIAHSSIEDVTSMEPQFLDRMESFWLSGTLKYFYLLFSDPGVVNLDEYVLSAQAHPFKRPS